MYFYLIWISKFYKTAVLVRVLQRNISHKIYRKLLRSVFISVFLHSLPSTSPLSIIYWDAFRLAYPHLLCGSASWRTSGADQVQRHLLKNSLLLKEGDLFVLCRPSNDLMRHTDIRVGNLIYPKFIYLNLNLIQKHHLSWHIKLTITKKTSINPFGLIKILTRRKQLIMNMYDKLTNACSFYTR